MNLREYVSADQRLVQTDSLAREMYGRAGRQAHNYTHAIWDAKKIAAIAEAEGHRDIAVPIAAALLHDTGVALGEYKDHALNSGKIARQNLPGFGFCEDDTEEIAKAAEEHNSWEHSSDTSRYLYDADTLNKAGPHGIRQCEKGKEEFGYTLVQMRDRVFPYFQSLLDKGYYTKTAEKIDHDMGSIGMSGLEFSVAYWSWIDDQLRRGCLPETEIVLKSKKHFRIQDGHTEA